VPGRAAAGRAGARRRWGLPPRQAGLRAGWCRAWQWLLAAGLLPARVQSAGWWALARPQLLAPCTGAPQPAGLPALSRPRTPPAPVTGCAGAALPLPLLAGQRYFSGLLDFTSEKTKNVVALLKIAGAEVLRELPQEQVLQSQRSAADSQQLYGMLASRGQRQPGQGGGGGGACAGMMVLWEKKRAPRERLQEARRLCPGCRVVPFDYAVDCVAAFMVLDVAAEHYVVEPA
jgi:hypothetical protein